VSSGSKYYHRIKYEYYSNIYLFALVLCIRLYYHSVILLSEELFIDNIVLISLLSIKRIHRLAVHLLFTLYGIRFFKTSRLFGVKQLTKALTFVSSNNFMVWFNLQDSKCPQTMTMMTNTSYTGNCWIPFTKVSLLNCVTIHRWIWVIFYWSNLTWMEF